MTSRRPGIDTGMSASFIASAVIHLAVFLLLVWWGQLFPAQMTIQQTYYVDVVNLPVSNPQSGSSAQRPGKSKTKAETEVPPPEPVSRMTAPAPAPAKTAVKTSALKSSVKPVKQTAPHESAESESAFNERMAKLERRAEAQHEEAVLEKLRMAVKNSGGPKIGSPGAGGTEAGSRYTDYIKSRLEDALKATISHTTKAPEVAVLLTIAANGTVSRIKIVQSSGDAAFELAVRRAIELASEKFTAPPNRTAYENGFIFKPKGISNSSSR